MIAIALSALLSSGQFDRVPLKDNPLFQDLGTYWTEQMPHYGVTGFSVVAIKDGKVVLLDSVGFADPFSKKEADVDTRYYIASVTKTMTATAIVQLAERGLLDLDAPVAKYLPRFTLADKEFAKTITIRDLLSHKPGITGGDVVLLDAYTGGITEDRYYAMLAESQPTKRVQYTNVHYTLLGRVIESVTGAKWQDYLASHVFTPSGMSRTTAFISACHDDPNLAPPLTVEKGGVHPAPYMKTDRTMHAAGGVMSTPKDMARFLDLFLNGGVAGESRLLKADSVAAGFEHQSTMPLDGSIRRISGFGYAWNVGDYREIKGFAAHGGGYTGYMSYIAMVPSRKTGIVVLVNSGGPGGAFGTVVAVDMLDRLLDYPIDTRVREGYGTQSKNFMARLGTIAPIAPNPALAGLLSLPAQSYEGAYHSEMYGNIFIRYSGGYLRFDWDDLPQTLKGIAMDEFTAHDDIGDRGTPGKFIVEGGRVAAVEMTRETRVIRFDRRP